MRPGERRKFKPSRHLYSRTLTINLFRLCWIVLVIWAELGVFFWSLSSCKWPVLPSSSQKKPTRVLLVADPQVQNPLQNDERPSLFSPVRRFAFDLNLKKSWHVTTRFRPHVVIFLGDMLASGRFVKDEKEYLQHVDKFKSIFTLDSSVSVYYIPGNNDVGMGVSPPFSKIRDHYLKAFGPFNQQVAIRNHTFVLLDAPGLVDEDYQRAGYGVGFDSWTPLSGGAAAFVKHTKRDHGPLFLLSHIPLARPDSASCGSLREKGTIRRGVGHGYQNTLGKQTTAFLLKTLQPSAVYSGDNRDYCEYVHTTKHRTEHAGADVREVTVKSFSMANHIRRPGFQLLSLIEPSKNDSTQKSFSDRPCLLPDQYGIYSKLYLPFFIVTSLSLVVLSALRKRQAPVPQIEPINISPQSSGESTPNPPPESAIWSPYTPAAPTSPRSSLPSHLRTPSTHAGSMFRASRPATPLSSPLPPPMYYSHEDDDEAMYPTQYALRRDGLERDEKWTLSHRRGDSVTKAPYFTSAPGFRTTASYNWSWSWTFVLRGRRRRVTIRAPTFSWSALGALLELLKSEDHTPMLRRRAGYMAVKDGLSIFWPVLIVWVLLAWWMF